MPNLFPESTEVIENNILDFEEPIQYKGSYLFDFEKGEFAINPNGTVIKCDSSQAYIQWCNKVMATPRDKRAYSFLYGQELKELIGSSLSKEAIELEIKRITQEALMVHPMTKEIINFNFNWSASREEVYFEYDVITLYDEKFTLNKTIKVG